MSRRPESTAVILATYRQPEWLEKALWGYAAQTHGDFELWVADDGSGPETRQVVERMAAETDLRLRHLRQEDRGHRKTRILNKAILATDAEYLIFSDGDCVPRDDLVETHLHLAEPGRFLGGAALRLPLETSRAMTPDDIVAGRAMRPGWLLRNGWRPGHRFLRILRTPRLSAFLDAVTPTKARFNGGNGSVWREAALEVNGFDHEMGYHGQDRAFGDRLTHLGLRCKQVRWRAVVLHLAHDRPYRVESEVRHSFEVRRRIWENEEVRARRGLDELSDDGPPRGDRRGVGGGDPAGGSERLP